MYATQLENRISNWELEFENVYVSNIPSFFFLKLY